MNPKRQRTSAGMRGVRVIVFAVVLAAGNCLAQVTAPQPAKAAMPSDMAPLIAPDQLDSLVAPVALYPDPLLAQVLAASTYPLEIMQLQQWLARNPGLKDQALADALLKQPWDASVEALAATPEVVKRLADDIQWTTDLGNAFLAQESDVMDAVQRMRMKAVDKNVLKTTEQQVVETKVIETKTVVVIQPANPQVIYVPTYSPVVVWGPPVYPYPPIYYPPPGYVALSFGIGVAMGYWWGGGGYGWNCGWGGSSHVTINNNNNYIRNVNNIGNGNRVGNGNQIGNGNRVNNGLPGGSGDRWQHRPEHRGGAPYRDRATADRFGGAARGDSLANRQSNARNQLGRQGGNVASGRPAGGGVGAGGGGLGAGGGNRANQGAIGAGGGVGAGGGGLGAGGGNRASQGAIGAGGGGNRAGGAGAANRAGGGGADRVGNRDLSRNNGGGNRNAFGGGGAGAYNGANARASSSRGAASVQSRGGRSGGGGGGARRR